MTTLAAATSAITITYTAVMSTTSTTFTTVAFVVLAWTLLETGPIDLQGAWGGTMNRPAETVAAVLLPITHQQCMDLF